MNNTNLIPAGEFIDYNFTRGRGSGGIKGDKIRVHHKKGNHSITVSMDLSCLLQEKGFLYLTYRFYRIPQTSVLLFGKEGNVMGQENKGGSLRWRCQRMVETLLKNTSINSACAEYNFIRKDMDDGRIALVLEGGRAV